MGNAVALLAYTVQVVEIVYENKFSYSFSIVHKCMLISRVREKHYTYFV